MSKEIQRNLQMETLRSSPIEAASQPQTTAVQENSTTVGYTQTIADGICHVTHYTKQYKMA